MPRSGSEGDAEEEQEGSGRPLPGNALVRCPGQQPAAPAERGTRCHTALAHQGDRDTAKGFAAEGTSLRSSQGHIQPEREARTPRRRPWSAEDQRYEELVLEILAKDRTLVDVLVPHPVRDTALDLLEGLFPASVSRLDKSHRTKGRVQHVRENE